MGDAARTPQQELERLTWEKAPLRYPEGIDGKVRAQLEHELELIGELDYAPYFLTVHSIVAEARRREILCQGRGSAANSAVRSEEHTSELQSLMRISYAVFCLKKKKCKKPVPHTTQLTYQHRHP